MPVYGESSSWIPKITSVTVHFLSSFFSKEMHLKDVDEMANSVYPDQTAPRSSLIRVCTVHSDLSVPLYRTFYCSSHQLAK